MQNLLFRTLNIIKKTESLLLLLFLFTAIVLAVTQIILRNFFDTGIFWADSALRIFVLWIGMLGAMYATSQRKHIKIDIFSRYLSRQAQSISLRIVEFMTALICAVSAFYSIQFIRIEYQDGLIAFANVPVWLCELIIPVAFTIMALRYFIYAFTEQPAENLSGQVN